MSRENSLWQKILRGTKLIINSLRTLTSLIFLLVFVTAVGGLTGALTANKPPPLDQKTALLLAPQGMLVDQKTFIEPLTEIFNETLANRNETLVRDVIRAVDAAANDPKITHLILNLNYLEGGGLTKLAEIGNALKRFKSKNKPIIAYADYFLQQDYYLAAHADEIILDPMGFVELVGFGAYRSYFADAIEKLEISANVVRVGAYKSAVEPFIENKMSDQVREETRRWIGSLWRFYTDEVETLRGLETGEIDKVIDQIIPLTRKTKGDVAEMVLNHGLVDRLASRTELEDYLNQLSPDEEGVLRNIDLLGYLYHVDKRNTKTPTLAIDKVAVIVAKGEIFDGEQPEGTIGGDTLAEMLAATRNDSDVAAIVLRIDSPGGSAFASEVIRDAISAIREADIPLVVSMGSVAASGGYWIAAEADRILAMPTSITGSIGIYALLPTFERSLKSLGITSDGVGTSRLAGTGSIDRALTDEARDYLQLALEHGYESFLNLVAKGRDMDINSVAELAGGRIWTGREAFQLGLIDQVGDLKEAIVVAAELADLQEYQIDFRQRPMDVFERLAMQLSDASNPNVGIFPFQLKLNSHMPKALVNATESIRLFQELNDPRGIYLYCAECLL